MTDTAADRQPNTDELTQAIRELPRIEASPNFQRQLMDRLDPCKPGSEDPLASGRAAFGWRAVAAAALLVAAAAGLIAWQATQSDRQRLQRLRAEHRAIEQELFELKRAASVPLPVIYLGGDDDLDVVLDPGTFRTVANDSRGARGTAVPVSFTDSR